MYYKIVHEILTIRCKGQDLYQIILSYKGFIKEERILDFCSKDYQNTIMKYYQYQLMNIIHNLSYILNLSEIIL